MTQASAESSQEETFGPVIFRYTRAQALEDGVLVDAGSMAAEAGFRCPVALSRAAWEDCVAWRPEDSERKGVSQDMDGRLADVLWMCYVGIRCSQGRLSSLLFPVHRVPRQGTGREPTQITLKCVIGPGDAGEPVLTIMLPHED